MIKHGLTCQTLTQLFDSPMMSSSQMNFCAEFKPPPNPIWEEPVGDLEAKRRAKKSNKPRTDIRTDGYDPLRHAGYSGPDEDAMRGYGKEDDDHIP